VAEIPAEPVAVIRLTDIYREQVAMSAQLAVMSEQLRQVPDHEARLRAVERRQWQIPAAGIGSATALAGAVTAILRAIH
jgi:hypothetical protein